MVGPEQALEKKMINILKKELCSKDSEECPACKQIEGKSYSNLLWLEPEKSYTKKDLEAVFQKTSLALEKDEKFFFVINKADLLNSSSANSLLKTIEEPPAGYYFFFLTGFLHDILPTIKSRSVIKEFFDHHQIQHQNLFELLSKNNVEANSFYSELERSNITEKESIQLVEDIRGHWINQLKINPLKKDFIIKKIDLLNKIALIPPMPGSSKIFWKNVILKLMD